MVNFRCGETHLYCPLKISGWHPDCRRYLGHWFFYNNAIVELPISGHYIQCPLFSMRLFISSSIVLLNNKLNVIWSRPFSVSYSSWFAKLPSVRHVIALSVLTGNMGTNKGKGIENPRNHSVPWKPSNGYNIAFLVCLATNSGIKMAFVKHLLHEITFNKESARARSG